MRSLLQPTIAGALIAIASFFAGELPGAVIGWMAVFALVWTARTSTRPIRAFFIAGVVTHLLGFYWLPQTLSMFGGFPFVVSLLFFAVYCAVSALQFALVGVLYKRLELLPLSRVVGVSLPLAWFVAETLVPRLFPWALCHFQLPWSSFAVLARYAGVFPLSAILLWVATAVFDSVRNRADHPAITRAVCVAAAFAVFLFIGHRDLKGIQEDIAAGHPLTVGIVQGNLEVHQKRDVTLLEANIDRYRALSREAQEQGTELLFWPETVVNRWFSESQTALRGTRLDAFPEATVPLFFGALAYRTLDTPEATRSGATEREQTQQFNAVLVRDAAGTISGRYYKQILMPFGEYLPFAKSFPSLKELSPGTGDFDAGDQPLTTPVVVRTEQGDLSTRVGMLICYEDLIPSLSREAALQGGELLVNFTNDAWYGRTAAPYQHHLLAAWRAVETGRYLLRATNTGLTGIVNPKGETERTLPIFEEGLIVHEIRALSAPTPYLQLGDRPVQISALFCCFLALLPAFLGLQKKPE